jgi:hypothetical protein
MPNLWLLSIGSAIYLFLQAPKVGKNRWIWALFGLIFGLLPLGVFFIRTTNLKELGWGLVVISIVILCLEFLGLLFFA